MHYSAKRGIGIACRPSVCPSLTLVDQDHIGWKSWKLTAISPTSSLFVAQKAMHLFPGERGEILGRLEVGWGKVVCRTTKAAIPLKRAKIGGTFTMESLEELTNEAMLFRTVPSPTLYGLFFPKTPIANISGMGEATNFTFGPSIQRVHPNKIPLKVLVKKEHGRI